MRVCFSFVIFCLLFFFGPGFGPGFGSAAFAQNSYEFTREIELGAIFTSGNTEDQNIKIKGSIEAEREQWLHSFTIDAFRSSSEDELTAQRIYSVAGTTYTFSEDHFMLTRLAHEDDRFSGYDSQTDLSVNYGQTLLRGRENMGLDYTVGAGVRYSRAPEDEFSDEPEGNFSEGFVRLAANYSWDISANALYEQTVSTEIGQDTTISRWESSIQTDIRENLSMKFSVRVKHQSEVPEDRENTDSEMSVTLLLRI